MGSGTCLIAGFRVQQRLGCSALQSVPRRMVLAGQGAEPELRAKRREGGKKTRKTKVVNIGHRLRKINGF